MGSYWAAKDLTLWEAVILTEHAVDSERQKVVRDATAVAVGIQAALFKKDALKNG